MDGLKIGGIFHARCIGPGGHVKWTSEAKNIIPNAGLNHILDTVFHAGSQVTTWYVGLKNAGSVAAADTLTSHAGWTENTNYTGSRKEFAEAAAASQAISNSASRASFAVSANGQSIAGAFIVSASTGTTGVLISVADFSGGAKSADSGDTIEVTYTVSAASS